MQTSNNNNKIFMLHYLHPSLSLSTCLLLFNSCSSFSSIRRINNNNNNYYYYYNNNKLKSSLFFSFLRCRRINLNQTTNFLLCFCFVPSQKSCFLVAGVYQVSRIELEKLVLCMICIQWQWQFTAKVVFNSPPLAQDQSSLIRSLFGKNSNFN